MLKTILLVLVSCATVAQRVELSSSPKASVHRATALGTWGVLHYEIGTAWKPWVFHRYDTTLNRIWSAKIQVTANHRFRGYEIDQGKLYLLFSRYHDPLFTIVTVDLETGQQTSRQVSLFRRIYVLIFRVIESKLFIAGYVENKPAVLHVDLEDNCRFKVVSPSISAHSRFCALEKDTTLGIVNITTIEERGGYHYMIGKSLSIHGVELFSFVIDIHQQGKYPLTGSIVYTNNYDVMVVGTYSSRPGGFAEGIYIAGFQNDTRRFTKFHNFGSLPNFSDYEPEHRRNRKLMRRNKKLSQGKDYVVGYNLLTHKPIWAENQLVFVAEVYYPIFQSEGMEVMVGAVQHPGYGTELDQYQFTHFMAVGFDTQGNVIWDNTFSLQNTTLSILNHWVHSKFSSSHVFMMHFEGQDRVGVYRISADGSKTQHQIGLPLAEGEKVKQNYFSAIQDWYADSFLVWGYQKLSAPSGKSRKVFYFSKLRLVQ